jgi:hypothetical protein
MTSRTAAPHQPKRGFIMLALGPVTTFRAFAITNPFPAVVEASADPSCRALVH